MRTFAPYLLYVLGMGCFYLSCEANRDLILAFSVILGMICFMVGFLIESVNQYNHYVMIGDTINQRVAKKQTNMLIVSITLITILMVAMLLFLTVK